MILCMMTIRRVSMLIYRVDFDFNLSVVSNNGKWNGNQSHELFKKTMQNHILYFFQNLTDEIG